MSNRLPNTVEILVEGLDFEGMYDAIDEDTIEEHFGNVLFEHLEDELGVEFDGLMIDAGEGGPDE
ncbi:hypothetical protein ACFQGT_00060 [Natrialbaceae archaeon GCM10025810]